MPQDEHNSIPLDAEGNLHVLAIKLLNIITDISNSFKGIIKEKNIILDDPLSLEKLTEEQINAIKEITQNIESKRKEISLLATSMNNLMDNKIYNPDNQTIKVNNIFAHCLLKQVSENDNLKTLEQDPADEFYFEDGKIKESISSTGYYYNPKRKEVIYYHDGDKSTYSSKLKNSEVINAGYGKWGSEGNNGVQRDHQAFTSVIGFFTNDMQSRKKEKFHEKIVTSLIDLYTNIQNVWGEIPSINTLVNSSDRDETFFFKIVGKLLGIQIALVEAKKVANEIPEIYKTFSNSKLSNKLNLISNLTVENLKTELKSQPWKLSFFGGTNFETSNGYKKVPANVFRMFQDNSSFERLIDDKLIKWQLNAHHAKNNRSYGRDKQTQIFYENQSNIKSTKAAQELCRNIEKLIKSLGYNELFINPNKFKIPTCVADIFSQIQEAKGNKITWCEAVDKIYSKLNKAEKLDKAENVDEQFVETLKTFETTYLNQKQKFDKELEDSIKTLDIKCKEKCDKILNLLIAKGENTKESFFKESRWFREKCDLYYVKNSNEISGLNITNKCIIIIENERKAYTIENNEISHKNTKNIKISKDFKNKLNINDENQAVKTDKNKEFLEKFIDQTASDLNLNTKLNFDPKMAKLYDTIGNAYNGKLSWHETYILIKEQIDSGIKSVNSNSYLFKQCSDILTEENTVNSNTLPKMDYK